MSSSSVSMTEETRLRRFTDLRGILWRIDLGVLPNSPSCSIDHLRWVTADSRRRYALLRRHHLLDPHIPKDAHGSRNLVIDNPLSQNPDSVWGQFFRNAELERMVDQDLSRLYPEHGSYFHTPGCQGMLRRILLLWCLRHPDHSYRQGMHELLAPLLYVLHVDVEHLYEVRKLYDNYFTDKFDECSFHESDFTCNIGLKKFSDSMGDGIDVGNDMMKTDCRGELDPRIEDIILLSDTYGAEGELGVVLSDKFFEHDAYCMFDALMSGAGGAVAMADFYYPSPGNSCSVFTPVIDAASAVYHLLSVFDSPLYSHLVELGVEPQYFALRWLRVLFRREFALQDLLVIWDEIFALDNSRLTISSDNDMGHSFGILFSSRGIFISAFAVAMILRLRSSLLATENATSCLQKLLSFPEAIDLKQLVAKAKALQSLFVDSNSTLLLIHSRPFGRTKSVVSRGHSISPRISLNALPECYWEEKWRVLQEEQERKQSNSGKQFPGCIKDWSQKVRMRLFRRESSPFSSKVDCRKRESRSIQRNLLGDLSQQLKADKGREKVLSDDNLMQTDQLTENMQGCNCKDLAYTDEQCLSGSPRSYDNSSIFSDPSSPRGVVDDPENQSGRSSAASNALNGEAIEPAFESCGADRGSSIFFSDSSGNVSLRSGQNDDSMDKSMTGSKERKLLSGKLQWLWKFGRTAIGSSSEKDGGNDARGASINWCSQDTKVGSVINAFGSSSAISKVENVDQNVVSTLRNLGQTMHHKLQVIESALLQAHDQAVTESIAGNVACSGQVTAMVALKELEKISNLLSEM